jgi:hypothetical protein
VHATNPQSLRPLGRSAAEAQFRTPACPTDHFDLVKGHALTQPGSEGLEARFLGGESRSERLRPVGTTGAHRALFPSEDLFLEPAIALGQRSRDPLDRDDVQPDTHDHGVTPLNSLRPRADSHRPHCLAISPLVTMPERPYPADGMKTLKKSMPLPSGPSSHTTTV